MPDRPLDQARTAASKPHPHVPASSYVVNETHFAVVDSGTSAGGRHACRRLAEIPTALGERQPNLAGGGSYNGVAPDDKAPGSLPAIIDLLHTRTLHDFTLHESGTLHQGSEYQMGIAGIGDIDRYRQILLDDTAELNLLAKDLLINVPGFFHDPQVFDLLAEKIIPELVRDHPSDQPIRIWIAGCGTGEETYSLAMLFREEITRAKLAVTLQVFAVDADAIASAQGGLYPETIAADVSPARLARFFSKQDRSYRISPELRATVAFNVQHVLADPPFRRLDMVSCRNLLIRLRPEARARVLSLFHFVLRDGGILLLGSAATTDNSGGRWGVISDSARVYRNLGPGWPGEFGFRRNGNGNSRLQVGHDHVSQLSRQGGLADLCRRLIIGTYAPAAVLINLRRECLFSLGPTDRYLHLPSGMPTQDILAMTRQGMRSKLRSAIQRASQRNARVVIPGGRTSHDAGRSLFSITVQPVLSDDGEKLLLVYFVNEPVVEQKPPRSGWPPELPPVPKPRDAIHDPTISSGDQQAIDEEARSGQEEYQSTNEELPTSKEQLQLLNEGLTVLNGQLRETLARQQSTANHLQNVLYSTDIVTIRLDTDLNIRFFTPASKALFNIIPSDLGRPLSDLSSLASDSTLLADARTALQTAAPQEREIEAHSGAWYIRRMSPYRTQDDGVEGVVITFVDITERRRSADVLEAAKAKAELANAAKSRFLAAASHDLRQPLQTLALVQGLLAKLVQGSRARKLVARLDDTLGAMSGMLNTLLDINQIDAGTVQLDMRSFPINDLLSRLRDEFSYHAQASGITLRVVPSSLSIYSDPRLLEQMIRNLLSNAIKYTKHGKVLLGCRRHGTMLTIQICDTGIGIADHHLQTIFEEYQQVDKLAGEHNRGLGLGLSIVQRLGRSLGHRIDVKSCPGKGSIFGVEVMTRPAEAPFQGARETRDSREIANEAARRTGTILVVEDEPDVRDLLEAFLKEDGHHPITAPDGVAALDLVGRGKVKPDLLLADYHLPNGMDGVQATAKMRDVLNRKVPVIMLTGDISTSSLRDIALRGCVPLNKPVKLTELTQAIQRLLPEAIATVPGRAAHPATVSRLEPPVVFVVDDDDCVRQSIRETLEAHGRTVEDYATCETFLEAYRPGRDACLVVDAYLPGMRGLELLRRLRDAGQRLPAIMITGNGDVPMAVQAMQAGAVDFIEKPIGGDELLASIDRATEQSQDAGKHSAWHDIAAGQVAGLTPRQRQIMERVLAGHPSKNIALDLSISQRTVENHRASIMKKTGTRSLPELARLALAAGWNHTNELPSS